MQLFSLFIYSSILAITFPILFPFLRLLYFAPFLILCYYHRRFTTCLWWSLSCGLIIDLLSSQTRLGNYAFSYCLTTICLYRYKFHFFEDRLSTLPIMTFCFVYISTIIQWGMFYTAGTNFSLSWEWIKSDFIGMPILDILYSLGAFTIPIKWVKQYFSLSLTRKRKA